MIQNKKIVSVASVAILLALGFVIPLVGLHGRSVLRFAAPPMNSYQISDSTVYPIKPTFTGWHGDTATALNNLRGQIQALVSGRAFSHATTSIKIVLYEPDNTLHPIYSLNASTWLPPASVEKLFTSSSTIWALGSKYSFSTKLDLATGTKVNGSTINGNVILRPSGDPTLTSSDLDLLADQLRYKGITTIQGDIISDLSGEDILTPEAKKYFADHATRSNGSLATKDSSMDTLGMTFSSDGVHPSLQSMVPPKKGLAIHTEKNIVPSSSLPSESVAEANSADSNADDAAAQSDEDEDASDPGAFSEYANFSIDRNIVSVTVTAGRTKGSAVSVRVWPPLPQMTVVNRGRSGAAASRSRKRIRVHHRWKYVVLRTRSRSTLRVNSSGGPADARQVISVSGILPARTSRRYSFAIRNVPLAMAALLRYRLGQHGIRVTGGAKAEKIVQKGEITTIADKETKLLDLLSQMNKRSDNYLAESMFRKLTTIVSVAGNAPDERARTLMRSWLRVCNADATQCTFIDGSGLSHSNRVSANTVIDLLHGIREQGMFDLFTRTLSIAGYDGTLRNRMIGTPAQYNAHGKTGTLNGVTALAGYVLTGDGQLASYFITMQNFRGGIWGYKQAQNQIVEALASFKYANYIPPPGGVAGH